MKKISMEIEEEQKSSLRQKCYKFCDNKENTQQLNIFDSERDYAI